MSRTGKHKTCSAGAQLQQRSPDELKQTKKSKIRQSSAQVTKQYQAKPIQNFTFNQPGNIFLQICEKAQSKHPFWKKLKYCSSLCECKKIVWIQSFESNFHLDYCCLLTRTH